MHASNLVDLIKIVLLNSLGKDTVFNRWCKWWFVCLLYCFKWICNELNTQGLMYTFIFFSYKHSKVYYKCIFKYSGFVVYFNFFFSSKHSNDANDDLLFFVCLLYCFKWICNELNTQGLMHTFIFFLSSKHSKVYYECVFKYSGFDVYFYIFFCHLNILNEVLWFSVISWDDQI